LQSQVGLIDPSQHFALPPAHPQTPLWCEQHPRRSAAFDQVPEYAPAPTPTPNPSATSTTNRLMYSSASDGLMPLRTIGDQVEELSRSQCGPE
jgi:hypothetical protein